MPYRCKGTCIIDHDARPVDGNPWDKSHWPKCSICRVKINWDGRHCPCCGTFLSKRTRTKSIALVKMNLRHETIN